MAAARVPRDVIELFLDAFCDGSPAKQAVAVCGLVSKDWVAPTRARLFSTVILRQSTIASFLHIVNTSSSSIQPLVRTLRLCVPTTDRTFIDQALKLGSFPEVTTLEIEADIGRWVGRMGQELFPNNFPRLANLDLTAYDGTYFSAYEIFFTIQDFPTLESLKVHGEGFKPLDLRIPQVNSLPPNWHTLHLEMPMSGNFFETFNDITRGGRIKMPQFTSLSMRDAWPQARSFLGGYLWRHGSKLQHLSFDASDENMLSEPEALADLTALRTLEIHIETSSVSPALLEIANELKSPELATINVIDPHQMSRRSKRDEMKQLDEVLAQDSFAKLSCFSFTGNAALESKLREMLPLCATRGIIRVV
ncbi:hypothetical protein FB45DRAFT_921892 [Roridomyces roridus]|uniref:Uncharacterized protein n=1 Tax=Roridomyces roridus TaxID=1738132 RepID=A0AAD7FIB1_9AGAR|nr:hypothetical protein FB45DRAFT_921892 [Roridomyces roridus]